jgi:REP element-mobilizing transposase RayT
MVMFKQRKHNRYKNFDYRTSGAYFVTICSFQKLQLFGNIINNKVELSSLGLIIQEQIAKLQDSTNLDVISSIVMPNHVHMLIMLQNEDVSAKLSLSDVIRRLKSKVFVEYNKQASKEDISKQKIRVWQRSYWDHIVRKEEDMIQIDEYITRNPEFCQDEQENPNLDYPSFRYP